MAASGQEATDLHGFHRKELPNRLALGNGQLALGGARRLPSLGMTTGDAETAFTYRVRDDRLYVEPGSAQADLQVQLSEEDWKGLITDLETAPGLLYGNRLRCLQGEAMQFVAWEPVLRAMYHGIPLYDPANPDLTGRHGTHDPGRQFSPQDDLDLMRDYLETVGYLVVNDIFSHDEINEFRELAESLRREAKQGDDESWWGKNRHGESVLCRVLTAGRKAPYARLHRDPRLLRLASMLPPGLHASRPEDKDGVTVIYKNPAMAEGLSDLPWHRDCGMGGHAIMCPTVILSIYLYDATDEAGALRFLPGSHRASFGFADAHSPDAPEGVRADARAGGVTLHFSDVMHTAPEPTSTQGPFRQSVLLTYAPEYQHHRGGRHYNDVLLETGDGGQIRHLRDVAESR